MNGIFLGTRRAFWFAFILLSVAMIADKNPSISDEFKILSNSIVVTLFFFTCSFRAKALGKSGLLWLTMLVPIVNIFFIFYLGCVNPKVKNKDFMNFLKSD